MSLPPMPDDAVRSLYQALMKNAQQTTRGSWKEALKFLRESPSDHVKDVLTEMEKRKLPGIAHEDGRFDYLCGSHWCRCVS